MKKCKDCLQFKSDSDFYGVQGDCKSCTKKRVALRERELRKNPVWMVSERKRHREKYHRLNYLEKHKPSPEKKKEIMERYKKKYPEKINAHLFLLSKKLKSKIQGDHLHHWSYNKEHWIDVIDLSEIGHNKLHRYMIYDQERMMYRTLEGILLDTKEKHIEYYESIKHLE